MSNWGEATLETRLEGIGGSLHERVQFARVLDLGCGEGLIARHCCILGAKFADAINIVPAELEAGRRHCQMWPVRFHRADLGDATQRETLRPQLARAYDVVLMLGILQKVAQPLALVDWALTLARGWVYVRVPARQFHVKHRPGVEYDLMAYLDERAMLVDEPTTSTGWLGVYWAGE